MNTKKFIRTFNDLDSIATEVNRNYNSNNAWGFGGAFGSIYYLPNDIEVRLLTACFRHTGTCPFIKIRHNGEEMMDVKNTGSNQKKAVEIINKLLQE